MKITINGRDTTIEGMLSLEEVVFLFLKNYQAVIVELNGEIIPKDKMMDIQVNEGDSIELIQFVGGG